MAKGRVLERLVARVPGFRGYRSLDERRADDRLLREHGEARLARVARGLAERATEVRRDERGEHDELVTQIELLREDLRLADRGYCAFFSDPELAGELEPLYARDERCLEQIEELFVHVASGEPSPGKLRGSVRRLRLALADRRNAILGLGSR